VWVRHRQRPQDQAVHEGEDRCVGTDAEGERQPGDGRHNGRGAECAKGEPEILHAACSATIVQTIRAIKPAVNLREGRLQPGDSAVRIIGSVLVRRGAATR
jgi:hypothetical protein